MHKLWANWEADSQGIFSQLLCYPLFLSDQKEVSWEWWGVFCRGVGAKAGGFYAPSPPLTNSLKSERNMSKQKPLSMDKQDWMEVLEKTWTALYFCSIHSLTSFSFFFGIALSSHLPSSSLRSELHYRKMVLTSFLESRESCRAAVTYHVLIWKGPLSDSFFSHK